VLKDALLNLIPFCSGHFVRHFAAAAEAALLWLFILKGGRGSRSVQQMLNSMFSCGGARYVTHMYLIPFMENNKGIEGIWGKRQMSALSARLLLRCIKEPLSEAQDDDGNL
jgi:hypothetical protein